jgi:hydrogenase maturation protein HypF
MADDPPGLVAERIRVRGLVQGVGFRPTVWRLARELALAGDVRNDGEGVLIRVQAGQTDLDDFCRRLLEECPVLARIDAVERGPLTEPLAGAGFHILASTAGPIATGVVADAATCTSCTAEIADPADRRYRYPFANCTHCGPRLSIVRAIPYDRANTSMAAFPLCSDCQREYQDPADRRFHAQPIACPVCGPRVWLEGATGLAEPDRGPVSSGVGEPSPPLTRTDRPDAQRDRNLPQDQDHPQADDPGAHRDPCNAGASHFKRLDPAALGAQDAVAAASWLLAQGRILAIKGIGGFHLACDASNAETVATLRQRKGRYRKPFALMARDLEVIRRHALLAEAEARLLASPAAPVVLLEARDPVQEAVKVGTVPKGSENSAASSAATGRAGWRRAGVSTAGMLSPSLQGCIHGVPRPPPPGPDNLNHLGVVSSHDAPTADVAGSRVSDNAALIAPEVAPGQTTLGFMLPYSPLHHLLLQDWDRPLVMTSGNRSEEPQCIANDEARQRLAGLADVLLLHDRDILNRVDDSVMRLMDGAPQPLRRARGLAPAPIPLPPGFEAAPPILAMGGELKNTLCLLRPGQAILSQHLGDLEDARTANEFERTLDLYRQLYQHEPAAIALDRHPDYRSSWVGRALAAARGIEVIAVQHHFSHLASVLADAGWPLDGGKVLGLAFDGLGWGEDGSVWGGEFLLADYRGWERLGHLRSVALPGGTRAMREPWRNLYAQLATCLGWEACIAAYPDLEMVRYLAAKPLATLDTMMARSLNSPLTSSAGRLFDAVAAALGICRDAIAYEGQAAIELETLALRAAGGEGGAYPFGLVMAGDRWLLDPAPMWRALLADLASGRNPGSMAARFHRGLAQGAADLTGRLAGERGIATIALSGGVFQNKTLFEAIVQRLRHQGLRVLTHRQVPANDGGLALGQAVVAAATLIPLSSTGC